MRQKNEGMWLSGREADLIDKYRQKDGAQKRAARRRVSKMYDEKIESARAESKKKR